MGYELEDRGSILDRGKRFSLLHNVWLWSLASLLSKGYRRLFSRRLKGMGVKLTIHLHLVVRARMVELYLHSPIRLHGVMLN
jgi:hypothetical protein